jgi:hypothetical protein
VDGVCKALAKLVDDRRTSANSSTVDMIRRLVTRRLAWTLGVVKGKVPSQADRPSSANVSTPEDLVKLVVAAIKSSVDFAPSEASKTCFFAGTPRHRLSAR